MANARTGDWRRQLMLELKTCTFGSYRVVLSGTSSETFFNRHNHCATPTGRVRAQHFADEQFLGEADPL